MKILNQENFVDKSEWPIRGEWDNEPDRLEWRYKNFPCLIVRSTSSGGLCGYVGIGRDHPFYMKHYNEVDIDIHGGLTFSRKCIEGSKICHKPLEGESDDIWWLGFDCAHIGDISPAFDKILFWNNDSYKNIDYVKNEVIKLANELDNKTICNAAN